MGRPPLETEEKLRENIFAFPIGKNRKKKLRTIAKQMDMTLSETIRRAIDWYYDQLKKDKLIK